MRVRNSKGRLLEVMPVSKLPMSNGQKVTLRAISVFASQHVCDPSYAQISALCGIEERTVQRAVKALEQRGFLLVTERAAESGYRLSNRYEVTVSGCEALQSQMQLGALLEVGAPGAKDAAGVVVSDLSMAESLGATLCPPPNEVVVDVVEQLQLTAKLSVSDQVVAADMLAHLPPDIAQQLADELRERLVAGRVRNPLGYLAGLVQAFEAGRYRPVLAGKGAKVRRSCARDESQ